MNKNHNESNSVFDKFTNQYQLSKTLRFELKPIGNTQQLLEDDNVFRIDEIIQQKYLATKPFFDRLHREFIDEVLSNISLTLLPSYEKTLSLLEKDKNNKTLKDEFNKISKQLREEIVLNFNQKIKSWINIQNSNIKLKNTDLEILFSEDVFSVLKDRYGTEPGAMLRNLENSELALDEDGKQICIFDSWKGFTGYFIKFQETRRNLYKSDGTSTALATRLIDQNLRRFCNNNMIYQRNKSRVDFSHVSKHFNVNLDEVFSITHYNLCLNQKGIDQYNKILGGYTDQNTHNKIQGLNELINEFRQTHKDEKLSYFNLLDKQILSEKESFYFGISDDQELLEVLRIFRQNSKQKVELLKEILDNLFSSPDQYDLSQIYLSKEALNTIKHRWFSGEGISQFEEDLKLTGLVDMKYKKDEEQYSFPDFITLNTIKQALINIPANQNYWKSRYFEEKNLVLSGIEINAWQQFLNIFKNEFQELFNSEIGYNRVEAEFQAIIEQSDKFINDPPTKILIKKYADLVLSIYQMGKYFAVEKKRAWDDSYPLDAFYTQTNGYNEYYSESYEKIVNIYNNLRNYLTKKPWSELKWKLNFDNSTLAAGWDENKEEENTSIILRKEDEYYLAIMKKGNNKIFSQSKLQKPSSTDTSPAYQKMVYKFFPDQAKMFPKVCFSKKGRDFFNPSDEIVKIYENDEFKKGDTFSIESMHKLINFYKDALLRYSGWKCYNFTHIKTTEEYQNNIGDFYSDVAQDGYQISFIPVSSRYIDDENQAGRLYLFKIHNKDWNSASGHKKLGTKNLHTLYFEEAFSEQNRKANFPLKLNGQAEIFYRPKTSLAVLGTKMDSNKNLIINHKRYSEDKIYFHLPLTFNRTSNSVNNYRFNQKINSVLANNRDINVIGIDRGEKNLAHYTVINQNEEILKMGSLNTVGGTQYAKLLEERSDQREQARKDWQVVEAIKDLKKGYISAVVRVLADLAIEYNAIIVFEDLNMRFKQIRGGIEKSVYQQLEKALIEKLSFLVDKSQIDPNKAGHLLHAYQLTAPIDSFKDMGKQTGIIFYTQAEYTSITDPISGFRKNIYISNSANKEKIRAAIDKFESIGWDKNEQSYFFKYSPINFLEKKEIANINTDPKVWTIYAKIPRIRREQQEGRWTYQSVDVNILFSQLFNLWEFEDPQTADILTVIKDKSKSGLLDEKHLIDGKKRDFWSSFIYYFNLILQIRNSAPITIIKKNETEEIEEGIDFIASPVKPFFTTASKYSVSNFADFEKRFLDLEEKDRLINDYNGDANGAYNIARKGLIILSNINKNPEKPDLYISKEQWDEFATRK